MEDMEGDEGGDPRPSRVIVTDEAFEELLDHAALAEESARGDQAEEDARRCQFAVSVDRAVKNAVRRQTGRAWSTQTLRRHRCRLHFLRDEHDVYLIACLALADDDD
jgi:hypothetical protein